MGNSSPVIAVAKSLAAALAARRAANDAMRKACDDLNAALIAARAIGVNFKSGSADYLIVSPVLVDVSVSSVCIRRDDFNKLNHDEQLEISRSSIGVF